MEVTYDLYKELDLDRSWDEDQIKKKLKELQRLWTKRQSACNDKEQLVLIDNLMSKIGEGFKLLIKKIRRDEYDSALDEAYKNGVINDVTEAQMQNLIDEARQYYRKGNIKLAAQCAQEAIEGKVNNPKAYDILAHCQYDMQEYQKALDTIDAGTEVFKDNLDLLWLGARIASEGTENYTDAQERINKLIEIAPDNSVGYSEQIYLHLKKDEEDLAFSEADKYIQEHPEDVGFKREVAYNIVAHSNNCFYYDKAENTTFIADKQSYDKCLKLRKKAVEIYNDEHTSNRLEDAEFFGQKEWDSWNTESIKCLTIYGILFTLVGSGFGLAFLAVDALVVYYSFRPYWQINKTYVTGKRGTLEQIVSVLGDITVKIGGAIIKFLWWFVRKFVQLVFALASGKFF